ncbi:MAG: ABC transporter permease [Candidatus Cloacimonetes bacterium]|nr:ABC transporter permease [Candidatus Cloacimonadota bacterium]
MIRAFLSGIGEYILFIGRVFGRFPHFYRRIPEIFLQVKRIGYDSLLLIFITSAFTGLVTALQAVYQTRNYIPVSYMGVMIGKSTMIELGPVLTALVLTGKVGASIAAEIGTMRVSEQIDALQSMSIKAEDFLYMPRVLAGLIAFPLLTIYSSIVGIICAWLFAWKAYGLHYYTFFNNMKSYFHPSDLWGGLVKSLFFGLIITSIGCFQGDKTFGGAEGVGKSTTQTVVNSAILILVWDFIVAWILF